MVKNLACQCRRRKRRSFDPWIRKIPWNRKWQPTPVFLPGKSHGQRSLAGYSPWGRKESNTTGLSTAAAVSTEPGLEISALSLSGGGPWASLHRSEPPSPFRTDMGITACPPPGGHEGEGPHWKHLAGIWRSVPRSIFRCKLKPLSIVLVSMGPIFDLTAATILGSSTSSLRKEPGIDPSSLRGALTPEVGFIP